MPMKIKSRIHFSLSVSICWGIPFTTVFFLSQKYTGYANVPLWLIIPESFLFILSYFILLYIFFPLIQKIYIWEDKNKEKRKEGH
jgi:hypothetical protein